MTKRGDLGLGMDKLDPFQFIRIRPSGFLFNESAQLLSCQAHKRRRLTVRSKSRLAAVIDFQFINDDTPEIPWAQITRRAACPLNDSVHRREFGMKRLGGNVNSGLDDLSRDQDRIARRSIRTK